MQRTPRKREPEPNVNQTVPPLTSKRRATWLPLLLQLIVTLGNPVVLPAQGLLLSNLQP